MAQRATCLRGSTGAVICTPAFELLTTGYNGAAAGQPHCLDAGCLMYNGHCIRANHAEANALMQAAKLGIPVKGAVMYCTTRPCIHCVKLVIQAGISRVHYLHEYETDGAYDRVLSMATLAGIQFEKWEGRE